MTTWPPTDVDELPPEFRPPEDDDHKMSRVGLVFATIFVLGTALFWAWAFSPWAPRGHVDEMDDTAFATFAEPLCAQTMERVAETPTALEATDLQDRAGQIETNTAHLQELVATLRAGELPAEGTSDRDLLELWFTDWDTYIGDRIEYSENFRAGRDLPFTVTLSQGDQVTQPIDRFAEVNKMASCATPLDV